MNHRVAILGGPGFIGRYIVKRLAERGDVLAVGGRHAAAAKFLKLKGDVGQVGLLNIAIDDERLLPAFLAGNQAVVNCVGILQERGSQRFDRVHHTAPARLARLARAAGIARLLHISASGAEAAAAGRTYELGGAELYPPRALMELPLAEMRRKRLLVEPPSGLATLQAGRMEILPNPPLTPDQVELLKRDNVVSAGAQT